MTLGFSIDELLPKARGGGQLKMGLAKLSEDKWLQKDPDLEKRLKGFETYTEGVQLLPEAEEPGQELAAMLGISGSLPKAAKSAHEDMCLLKRDHDGGPYRLIGAAVAWPSDWTPADKLGLPLRALHEPIQGYEEQLATPVDTFMGKLQPGAIYGRCNWFIAHTPDMRWIGAPPKQAFADVAPENAGERLFVRSERQTLRKLPETGAILFTIGIYVAVLGKLSRPNIAMLSEAMEGLLDGEGDRRGAAYYAQALQEYHKRMSS